MTPLLLAIAWAGTVPPIPVDGWLLTDARVVDANGVREVEAILLRGDRIEHVGDMPEQTEGLAVLDLDGASVVPGLVDAHVHLSMTPSGAFLEPSPDEQEQLWRHHLAAYIACGVTTVLDTGIAAAAATRMNEIAAEGPAPDIHYLGPILAPAGGYPAVVIPELPAVATAEDVERFMTEFEPLEPIGVKITVERGMVTPVWPLYSDEVREALRAGSDARGWPLYAHAISNREYRTALDIGVAGFVHPPQAPNAALIETLVERDLPVVTTASIIDVLLAVAQPERLDDPLVQLTVPAIELEAAADPAIHAAYSHAVSRNVFPKMPGFMQNYAASIFRKERPLLARTAKQQASIRALHEAGVTLVVGSDSGNWPVFPFEFHGSTTLRELEVLQEGGIPPLEVLRAATVNGARLLGIEDEIGTIDAGKRADLIVVDGDPAADLSVLRDAQWISRAGEIDTPAGWMSRVVSDAGEPR